MSELALPVIAGCASPVQETTGSGFLGDQGRRAGVVNLDLTRQVGAQLTFRYLCQHQSGADRVLSRFQLGRGEGTIGTSLCGEIGAVRGWPRLQSQSPPSLASDLQVGPLPAHGREHLVFTGAGDDGRLHEAVAGKADADTVRGIAALEVVGAVDRIEDQRIFGVVARKPAAQPGILLGNAAHERKVLQHGGEDDVLKGGVEHGECARCLSGFFAVQGRVDGLADVGDLAEKDQRGLRTLAHDGQQHVDELMRIDALQRAQPAAS